MKFFRRPSFTTMRENAVVVPVRPKAVEVEKFFQDQLRLDVKSVKNLHLHNVRNCVYIEFHSKESADAFAASHHLKHSIASNKVPYNIPV